MRDLNKRLNLLLVTLLLLLLGLALAKRVHQNQLNNKQKKDIKTFLLNN